MGAVDQHGHALRVSKRNDLLDRERHGRGHVIHHDQPGPAGQARTDGLDDLGVFRDRHGQGDLVSHHTLRVRHKAQGRAHGVADMRRGQDLVARPQRETTQNGVCPCGRLVEKDQPIWRNIDKRPQFAAASRRSPGNEFTKKRAVLRPISDRQ